MTEAKFGEKKNKQSSGDNRISTHPSYTEYAWESLVNSGKQRGEASGDNSRTAPMRSEAAVRRPASGVGAQSAGRGIAAGRKSKAAAGSAVGKKTEAAKSAAQTKNKSHAKSVEKIRKKSMVAVHTITVEKKYAFPMSVVMIAACFTVLIMAIVTTSVQINEITGENAALSRTYTSLVNEENELRLLLETRDDLRVVETVAKEELGMVKKDQVERYYLTVHKEDRIEIVEDTVDTGTSFFDGVMSFGGSVVERIRGFFGM